VTEQDAYNELQAYTLGHGDPAFIHQHVVDAWMAQHADEKSKPMGVAFALAGLYLHVEKSFSGKRVQHAHMIMARRKRDWPSFAMPVDRGAMTALDVIAAPAGAVRDRAVDSWCASVWSAFRESHARVAALVEEFGLA
jgi:hypothetical protein